MGKNGPAKNNNTPSQTENQETILNSNDSNLLSVNAPGGVSIQVLGMDIQVKDLQITIGPDANIGEIHSIIDQLKRRA